MWVDDESNSDIETFRQEGVLALRNVIDQVTIATLKQHFWQSIERSFAIREDDPASWFARFDDPVVKERGYRLSGTNAVMDELQSNGSFEPSLTAITKRVNSIFGAERWEPLDKWYSLLTFPGTEGGWNVPHQRWHSDEPIVVGDDEPWSLFAFVFLDVVDRATGPTVAVTGSHRRGEVFASRDGVVDGRQVRAFSHVNRDVVMDPDALRLLPVGDLLDRLVETNEWFAELCTAGPPLDRMEQFVSNGTSADGTHCRVTEITGSPGDVVVFDPRALHSPSRNVSGRPRQVLRIDLRRLAPS